MIYETTIVPPAGMTQDEFDKAVLKAADDYPIENRLYNPKSPNSNAYEEKIRR